MPQLSNSTPFKSGFGVTERKDLWWLQPLLVVFGLGSFGIYSTWAAFQGTNYQWGPYLSPFYSPLFLFSWWHWSPALLILWAPLGFRATCYYYRKAYYRSFFLDPPACAVGEIAEHRYSGETKFPFILQNIHRYFLYFAIVIICVLWVDAIKAFWFDGKFGMGVGTIVLCLNATFLSLYTFSCHSLRHIIGGKVDCFSSCKLNEFRHKAWSGVSILNERHMLWAWISLCTVGGADVYVRLCAMGVIHDFRIF